MDKDLRSALERATQKARILLESDFADQLTGLYDVLRTGSVAPQAGLHLSPSQKLSRAKIVMTIEHKRASGMKPAAAVADYLRDAAFTCLNRFTALKMLEARNILQECISRGDQSSGYREFQGLAPGLGLLPEGAGYRLYMESIFDELSAEIKVLFDRRDPAAVLWPRRQTFENLLAILNEPALAAAWNEEETIGWVYQYFNSGDERKQLRDPKAGGSQEPRNSRELAIRNQFFTPHYVVQFLTDNTLGRIWYEMREGKTRLVELCEYLVQDTGKDALPRPGKDPRDLRVLDPACGSGHFLLYAFDLLVVMYEEAWTDEAAPTSEVTGRTLRQDYPELSELKRQLPALVLQHNLYGVDIDPRCAQIAQLALWMRAQTTWLRYGISRADRPIVRRANIIIAEPMPGEADLVQEFATRIEDGRVRDVFLKLVDELKLAGDLGLLLRVETILQMRKKENLSLFLPSQDSLRIALEEFLAAADAAGRVRRRLFTDDAVQGVGLLELASQKYDVVLMNPPFGAGSMAAKKEFEKTYPKTKNDIYAAFVQRGIELLHPRSRLGAITSRTGFFLSSFRKWREDILLVQAPPVLFADLGAGVLDSAMVETAAYCLEVKP